MRVFAELCPRPPHWRLDWTAVRERFPWVRDLAGVAQDPVHHAEGDVETHTRLACEALAALPRWRERREDERTRLFAATLLHDVAKPRCTREEDGRITAHGHSRHGDLMARRILWELGAPIAWREYVAALVRHHQVPFWGLERADLQPTAFRVSLLAANADLVLLAEADLRGRECADLAEMLENVALYEEYCAEEECLDGPRAFPSDHARFQYFRTPGRDPSYAAYDDTRLTATVLSGLPAAGKDTWIATHRPGLPVVSLDALRAELGVSPAGDQRPVVTAAFARAKEHLRAGRPFVWNATNTSRQIRERCIALAADYRARIELVSLEAAPHVLHARNRARPSPVPDAVIARLAARWETPDPTEAHTVTWLDQTPNRTRDQT
ncbi:AAA family ATPase [Actinocorallia libanotica]|uniref:AAA family ATPase n=1 Tax=Actinocorallia libanotica TaxID=46162 RepID=A0ABP4CJ92_9ACTN